VKKILYLVISVVIIIIISVLIFELFLQCIPVIYRNLPKDDKKTYVYILGESSSWGHPYKGKISFSKIIDYYINTEIDGKEVEFIMLAEDGQRLSQQYLRYYKYKLFHPFRKGILLAYMGTNDWSYNFSEGSNTWYLNIYLLGFVKNYFNNMPNFRYEYEKIVFSAQKFGDEIYLSTILGNYAGCRPNNIISLMNDEELRKEIIEIDNLISNKEYDAAFKKCNNLLDVRKDKSQIWYRIGKIYERRKQIKEANAAYLNGIEYGEDPRPTRYQNKIIRELAVKYDVPLVDVSDKIDNLDEIIGYNYFIDIIHPAVNLHIIIAKEFLNALSKRHRINIIRENNDIYGVSKIENVMNFGRQDMFSAYRDALGEIFFYSFYKNISDLYNIPKMQEYIEKLKELDKEINYESEGNIEEQAKRKDIIYISELIFAYIQGNYSKVKEMLNNKKIVEKIKFEEIEMQCWWAFKNWIIDFMYKTINNEVG